MEQYIEIKKESDAIFLNKECKELFTGVIRHTQDADRMFPMYINSNGQDWFSESDTIASIISKDTLNECNMNMRESISVQEYAKSKLNKENQ